MAHWAKRQTMYSQHCGSKSHLMTCTACHPFAFILPIIHTSQETTDCMLDWSWNQKTGDLLDEYVLQLSAKFYYKCALFQETQWTEQRNKRNGRLAMNLTIFLRSQQIEFNCKLYTQSANEHCACKLDLSTTIRVRKERAEFTSWHTHSMLVGDTHTHTHKYTSISQMELQSVYM